MASVRDAHAADDVPSGWTPERIRHAVGALHYGRRPAATVYESLGTDFFLALAPRWLNLGLWEGDGSDPHEAPLAVRRLVRHLARDLPRHADLLDVGNGLAEQDPVIVSSSAPRSLTALNLTVAQLREGRARLAEAGAHAVGGDAVRMPLRSAAFDGVICVEAAFHFSSRGGFFDEAIRVLRPGGVLTMSDIATNRYPLRPREAFAALTQLRGWGLGLHAAASAGVIARSMERAGFVDVRYERAGDRTIAPALRFAHLRLDEERGRLPATFELTARFMLAQAKTLWDRGVIDYLFLHGRKPDAIERWEPV